MALPASRIQLGLALTLLCGAARAQSTQLVSVSTGGVPANAASEEAVISTDGRFVGYRSLATNLSPLDTDPAFDAYLWDRSTGVTELISVASNGTHVPGFNLIRSISADGNLVCFESNADNLVPGDTGADSDLFIRDRAAGTTTIVSVDSNGVHGNDNSELGLLTPDGRYVAFRSHASNLVAGDTNNEWDVFLHDRLTGTTERINLGPGGAEAHGDSYVTAISPDARFALFSSLATDLVVNDTNNERDVFVHDRQLVTTRRISVSTAGVASNGDNHAGFMSADGRIATFVSFGDNLVPGDTNGIIDVFARDLVTNVTTRISVSSSGGQSNAFSVGTAISADGRFVCFESQSNNLVPGDAGFSDVFVRDRWSGQTTRVGLTASNTAPNLDSWGGAMSADGRYIAFHSVGTNMGTAVPGGFNQVYLRDNGLTSPFAPLCTGDIAASCPCGNNGTVGQGEGCLNSFGHGGKLVGSGTPSLANDTLVLSGSQMSNSACLYFQGTTPSMNGSGVVFGDGLRCAIGVIARLGTKTNVNGASQYPLGADADVSARGGVFSPGTRIYQVWYRNIATFCTLSTFNLTNGLRVQWTM